MVAQQKLLRVLRLIMLLEKRQTLETLASYLETTQRTVYRYMELLEEVGFIIDKSFDSPPRYFICRSGRGEAHEQARLLTAEEYRYLAQLIEHGKMPGLLQKLQVQTETTVMAQAIQEAGRAKVLSELNTCIEESRIAVLIGYASSNSKSIRDRKVLPLLFMHGKQHVWALDRDSGAFRQFQTDRIESVKVGKKVPRLTDYPPPQTDLFGWQGERLVSVKLLLSARAVAHMKERVPELQQLLVQTGRKNEYVLETEVYDFQAIAPYILGLPGEVRICHPPELLSFVKEQSKLLSTIDAIDTSCQK